MAWLPFGLTKLMLDLNYRMLDEFSVTRLGDLEPIGLQIELTGSFLNFRRAQLIGH
jgi:hypothetical protein